MPGTPRALCERCMPRLEGDFLFCWTAMLAPGNSVGWWGARAAAHGERCRQLACYPKPKDPLIRKTHEKTTFAREAHDYSSVTSSRASPHYFGFPGRSLANAANGL